MSLFICNILFAQQREAAEKIVNEGIPYHDKGDYDGALSRYDQALALDKDNLLALCEKALTLLSANRPEECIKVCKTALEKHPGENTLNTLYVTYGNALDVLKKTDKAIDIYNEGIKYYPVYYQLYFNKGITLESDKRHDEALLCAQKSVILNPKHPGSHNMIAIILKNQNKRIPAILAYGRFLVLEPQSDRAKNSLKSIQNLLSENVKQNSDNSVSINLDPALMKSITGNGKPKENNFNSIDLLLTLNSALDSDPKFKTEKDVEKFIRKIDTICSALKTAKNANSGFYWDYYVPYFIDMKNRNFIETFGYIAFASTEDPDVMTWLKGHKTELDKFFEWSSAFAWKTN